MTIFFPPNPTTRQQYGDFQWDGNNWITVPGRCSWLKMTQAEYDALDLPDPGILYVIVG
jgi:hypothetical protein